jgi:AraC-like DNA-binding protein
VTTAFETVDRADFDCRVDDCMLSETRHEQVRMKPRRTRGTQGSRFDYHALLVFLDAAYGKSLLDIAGVFGVSIRTVQRRLNELRERLPGVEVRESVHDGIKRFRCIRATTSAAGLRFRGIMELHQVRMAARVLLACGLVDNARELDALAESMMRNMPRAMREQCERRLQKLASFEAIEKVATMPVAPAGVADALRLALVAERKIILLLSHGESIRGQVKGINYSLDGCAAVSIELEVGGSCRISLREVDRVCGVEDLSFEDLRAA